MPEVWANSHFSDGKCPIIVQTFLLARFKEIDQELAAAIPALLRLADDRLAEALLQWSREEFLALARQSEPQE